MTREQLINMTTARGFMEEFYRARRGATCSSRETFDRLNQAYFDEYGVWRYSEYHTFVVARSRYIRRRRRNSQHC